jgi:predicted nucleic acid-binding protein
MRVFVDTSAFFAYVNRNDQNHLSAKEIFTWLIRERAKLICTNYVLLETVALLQNRLGMLVVKDFQESVVPLLRIEWVDEELHQTSVAVLLTANRRHLSMVDCTSFTAMRRLGIGTVFAFDQHFVEQGFTIAQAS